MKKILSFMLVAAMILVLAGSLGIGAEAASTSEVKVEMPLRVVVNGEEVNFPDGKPFIDENGRTEVPVSFVSKALGAQVQWTAKEKLVTINRNKDEVLIRIGDKTIYVNGQKVIMDTKAIIKDNRTYVPAKYIADSLGGKITWDGKIKTVYIDILKDSKSPIAKKGEVKYYSGIAFNNVTDVMDDGRMTEAKAKEFMLKSIYSTSFIKKDGKYYVKGFIPQVPPGYQFQYNLLIEQKNNKPMGACSLNSHIPEDIIKPNKDGYFEHWLYNIENPNEFKLLRFWTSIQTYNAKGAGEYCVDSSINSTYPNRIAMIKNYDDYDTKYISFDVMGMFQWN